ncbi:hypothetical protein WICPIJ_002698 [Wickerhamomyces pijperi]|uniref:Extracellular membrane protein CFEM domain-containing protein n=1 Tax=Wickerhamomyces pijperi TaxID=599730 RepID=A0A9P8Q9B8_WICPI|nr:hypothetical protein WICPIJ_002698 [Wickerhamomyces pijperi]
MIISSSRLVSLSLLLLFTPQALATPPACFLSCVQVIARWCDEGHADFRCICDNSPSLVGCLVDICPYGNFFSARDHFWGTCLERLTHDANEQIGDDNTGQEDDQGEETEEIDGEWYEDDDDNDWEDEDNWEAEDLQENDEFHHDYYQNEYRHKYDSSYTENADQEYESAQGSTATGVNQQTPQNGDSLSTADNNSQEAATELNDSYRDRIYENSPKLHPDYKDDTLEFAPRVPHIVPDVQNLASTPVPDFGLPEGIELTVASDDAIEVRPHAGSSNPLIQKATEHPVMYHSNLDEVESDEYPDLNEDAEVDRILGEPSLEFEPSYHSDGSDSLDSSEERISLEKLQQPNDDYEDEFDISVVGGSTTEPSEYSEGFNDDIDKLNVKVMDSKFLEDLPHEREKISLNRDADPAKVSNSNSRQEEHSPYNFSGKKSFRSTPLRTFREKLDNSNRSVKVISISDASASSQDLTIAGVEDEATAGEEEEAAQVQRIAGNSPPTNPRKDNSAYDGTMSKKEKLAKIKQIPKTKILMLPQILKAALWKLVSPAQKAIHKTKKLGEKVVEKKVQDLKELALEKMEPW